MLWAKKNSVERVKEREGNMERKEGKGKKVKGKDQSCASAFLQHLLPLSGRSDECKSKWGQLHDVEPSVKDSSCSAWDIPTQPTITSKETPETTNIILILVKPEPLNSQQTSPDPTKRT